MGEEWGETRPFTFSTDFHGALAAAVREGRRQEFRKFSVFGDAAMRKRIPDPNAESTFLAARLDWARLDSPEGRSRHRLLRRLLAIRRAEIVPRLRGMPGGTSHAEATDDGVITVRWRLGDGCGLTL